MKLDRSKDEAQPIENQRKIISVKFLNRLKPSKMFRVLVQLSNVWKENPSYVLKTLGRLVSYSCEIWEVLYLLTLQASTGTRSTIKCWWNLVAAKINKPWFKTFEWDLKVTSMDAYVLQIQERRSSWIQSLHMVVSISYYWR